MKLLPVIFERNKTDFGAIAGHYGEKIQRNCSQKEPKEQDKIKFRKAQYSLLANGY
ncbi:MAG: hypothetical protein U0X71_09290 [Sphingobacteriaceae bacterium]